MAIVRKLQEQTTSNKMTKYFHQLLHKLQKQKTNLVRHPPPPTAASRGRPGTGRGAPGDPPGHRPQNPSGQGPGGVSVRGSHSPAVKAMILCPAGVVQRIEHQPED